jgi:ATP/maltotriose-dependent transcriptional regulator MalT
VVVGRTEVTEGEDELAATRAAIAQHDWQGALDEARAIAFDDPAAEADRADLEAEAAWWLGRLEDCISARERAYRLYEELGDQRRAGQCAVWLWEHHAIYARPSIASGWLRRARRALGHDTECVEYGALLLREAETAHGAGELDQAGLLVTEALALGRRLRSADLEAEALQTYGRILIDQGRLDEGMGHLDEAMLFAVEGRLRAFSTGKVYCSLIAACEEVGDFDRAAEWTEATLRWAEQHPFAIWPGVCRVHRAVVLKRRGSLAEAEVEAARACDELRQSHVGNSAAAYAEVGDICRRLGELDRAETAFARAQEINGGPSAGLALLRLAQGRDSEAMSIITACVAGQINPLARAGLLPTLVHVAVAIGDLEAARRALNELEATVEVFSTPNLRAILLSTRGRLELAEGTPDARSSLQQAVDAWRALEVPYEEATTRTLLGQALRSAGDDAAATESFEAAAALFDQIGAHLDAQLVHGDTKVPLPAGLTEREVQVLRLIAAGLTNNEIASELFLSAKTVSRHLSNIFTKVGVTSRAGATAFAFEHHLVAGR